MTSKQKSVKASLSIVDAQCNHDENNVLPWSRFGHIDVLQKWTAEVKNEISSNSDIHGWHLVGHAITIVDSDHDRCKQILCRVAFDLNIEFRVISASEICDAFSEGKNALQITCPTLIYLQPNKFLENIDYENSGNDASKIQDKICALIKSFDPLCPVLLSTSIEDFSGLSKSFRQAGLFDRRFSIIDYTVEELGNRFVSLIGHQLCADSITNGLVKVGKLVEMNFSNDRRQGLIALRLKRIAHLETRKVEFADLVHLAMVGSAESDAYPIVSDEHLLKVAVHEAGHASISIIDSNGANIPEYLSIIESDSFSGVVADSYDYHYARNNETTYLNFRHSIRVYLAGRAAEHFIYGTENISTTLASADLKEASELCTKMFSLRGISDDMESSDGVNKHLKVISDNSSQSELAQIESMVNSFLSKQYKIVYNLLEENKLLLSRITDKLVSNKLLDQSDLLSLTNLKK